MRINDAQYQKIYKVYVLVSELLKSAKSLADLYDKVEETSELYADDSDLEFGALYISDSTHKIWFYVDAGQPKLILRPEAEFNVDGHPSEKISIKELIEYGATQNKKKVFHFYQDVKLTIWERTQVQIYAETEEEARAIAVKLAETGADADDFEDVVRVSRKRLDETEEYMFPSENDGQATVEVYAGRVHPDRDLINSINDELIADNSLN